MHIDEIAQAIERLLENHDIHLTTDDFNRLHDFLEEIMQRIRETGQ